MPHSHNMNHFTCEPNGCGHRFTAPEALNAYAHHMDTYAMTGPDISESDKTRILEELHAKHAGNTFSITKAGHGHIINVARSYATVKHQSDPMDLAMSDHIILACPNCGKVAWEGKW